MSNNTSASIEPFNYGNWWKNSFSPAKTDMTQSWSIPFNAAMIAVGVVILLHSLHLNGRKLTSVRICADAAAIALIGQCATLIPCTEGCGIIKSAVFSNILSNAIFNAMSQVADNYITFVRCEIIHFHHHFFFPHFRFCVWHQIVALFS